LTHDDPASEPDGAAVSHLEAAVDAFHTFREDLNALLHEVRQGRTARARKLAPAITDLSRAVSTLAREARNVEAEHAHANGPAAGALDLDAARAEIRRRLARRRAAGDGAAVSRGAG
jgi:hypothetical protein